MKYFWLALITALFAVSIYILVSIIKYRGKYRRPLIFLIFLNLYRIFFYGCFIISSQKTLATIFFSFYSVMAPWILFSVIELVCEFAGQKLNVRGIIFRCIITLALVLDFVSLSTNIFIHQAFELLPVYKNGLFSYWNPQFYLFYKLHLGLCYAIAFYLICFIGKNILQDPKIYRPKYVTLETALVMSLIFTVLFYFIPHAYDTSVLFYSICVIIYVYLIVISIPRLIIENLMVVVSENVTSGVICFDNEGKCIYKNQAAQKIFKSEKFRNQEPEAYRNKIAEIFKNDETLTEYEEQIEEGKEIRKFSVFYKELYGADNKFQGSYIKFDDRSEEIKRIEQERYDSSHDELTGLLNRKAFFQQAAELIRKNPGFPRYIIVSDIENFKLVNDIFGQEVGDSVLRNQAKYLSDLNYPGTLVSRTGSDKFALLIPKQFFKPEIAVMNVKRVQECLSDRNYKLHVYLGVYEITNPEESVESMYDKALLAIKDIYGSYELTLSYYDNKTMQKILYETNIMNEFANSIENKQFIVFLQPQIDCKTGKVLGAEALARWHHSDYGVLDPSQFISILEKSDSIFHMDLLIWEMVCEKLREWKKKGYDDMYISVNISSRDFYYGDLFDVFTGLVEKYGISPENLNLEITETSVINDMKFHSDVLNRLKNYGFKVEIDDFGTGYSSLNTLKDLNADILKIDMSFITDKLDGTMKNMNLVKLIVNMAKKLGMNVIVEGTETKAQIDFLKDVGCDIFQGFYYSQPIPIEKFEEKYFEGGM